MADKTCFFTIVSNNYRHFARALVQSVRQHDPALEAFVAICDDPPQSRDARDQFEELPIRELGLPKFDRFTFQYTILELNTAIKPSVIAALFARGYERVVYFDPDIKLYGSVAPILDRLESADIVLTPHLTGRLDDDKHPSELAILQSGTYNLGFIALRNTEITRRFVQWWQGKLVRDCVVDIPRGLFTDQKWIDLVPGMYARVHVERDPGWNVAYWNLAHRAVTREGGSYKVDGRPLLFFHYSGFDPGGSLLSKHQDRFNMANVPPAVRALANEYADDLARAGIEQTRKLPYAFARFPSGAVIPDRVRRCYREDFPWANPHPDLWTAAGEAALLRWLNAPTPHHGSTPWLSRFALALHRQRVDLQRAFPDVDGAQSRNYAQWFIEHAATQEKIPDSLIEPVRDALASGEAAELATGDATVAQGRSGGSGLSRGVFRAAYRLAWGARRIVKPITSQAFRHRIRHALMRKAYFDRSYVTPPLVLADARGTATLSHATPAVAYPPHSTSSTGVETDTMPGINVIGYLTAESGVGESARSMLRILKAAGVRVKAIDFRVGNISRMGERAPIDVASDELHAINLFHVNADQMFVAREILGATLFEGRYNVGCWAWELAEFPDVWVPALSLVDEVWTLSSFAQQAIGRKSPRPVLRVPCSVEAPPAVPERARFGIADDEIAFFAMCDVLSVPERKNPLGVVEAFRRAFPANERVRLLIKVGNVEFQPDLHARLREVMRADVRIVPLVGYLARAELWSLMASIDCFVSLHRAEGFGLGMAEAMACGKSVIATGWSGNVDFTRQENSLLVDYSLVTLDRDLGPYARGQQWAEPDLDSAADAMRRVAGFADLRERLSRRGLETVARELSPAALAPLVRERLRIIDELITTRQD